MKRTNLILLLVLIALPIAYYFLNRDVESNAEIAKDYFSIKEIGKIDKIFISENKTKKFALLTKDKNDVWKVNNNWVLNESRLRILFETFRDMEVKYEVDEAVADQILTQIAATGVKTMIYDGDKLLKTYFVGMPTNNMLGTYLVEAGSKKPVVVHIPGMNGFISSRYFTDSVEWRNKNIFNIPKTQIKEVKVEWNNSPESSYIVSNAKNGPTLTDLQGQTLEGMNELKVKAFLNLFMVYEKNNLACEGFHKNFTKSKADSIAKSNWYYKVSVTSVNEETKTLVLWRKPIQVNTYSAYSDDGELLQYEIDKYWGIQDNEGIVMEIQDLVFSKIMKKKTDFK